MRNISLRAYVNILSALVVVVYGGILLMLRGQFRSEMLVVAYIALGIPITGLFFLDWVTSDCADRWKPLDVLRRGLFIASLFMQLGAVAWLYGQMIQPYHDAIPPFNVVGRWFQPYQYAGISLGSLRAFLALTTMSDRPNVKAILIAMTSAAALAAGALAAVVYFHAVAPPV